MCLCANIVATAVAGEDTSSKFVTTIHAIQSGLLKLSALTPVMKVYRGVPDQLELPGKFGGRHGIEYGFMRCVVEP